METVVILVNDQIAAISGNAFTIDDLSLDFGANEITLEAIDFAGKSNRRVTGVTGSDPENGKGIDNTRHTE